MARSVTISTKKDTAEIIIDGNEISDVLSYTLTESANGVTLTLEIQIIGSVEAQIE